MNPEKNYYGSCKFKDFPDCIHLAERTFDEVSIILLDLEEEWLWILEENILSHSTYIYFFEVVIFLGETRGESARPLYIYFLEVVITCSSVRICV